MARRMLVAGNWKMNGRDFAAEDMQVIDELASTAPVEVALCVPATMIHACAAAMPQLPIGGQDCHAEKSGAFTGWLSAQMLGDAGATMVIVGHSERRAGATESDGDVRAKADAALAAGLTPIICVGESAGIREAGGHIGHVLDQLTHSLPTPIDSRIVIAYEPIWAIGTGKVAMPVDVAEMHAAIRGLLIANHGVVGQSVRILYGGSVTGANAAELFAIDDVDGALVGGASLSAEKFVPIIEAAIAAAG
jgi:triosephosphate isomerase (TIM)